MCTDCIISQSMHGTVRMLSGGHLCSYNGHFCACASDYRRSDRKGLRSRNTMLKWHAHVCRPRVRGRPHSPVHARVIVSQIKRNLHPTDTCHSVELRQDGAAVRVADLVVAVQSGRTSLDSMGFVWVHADHESFLHSVASPFHSFVTTSLDSLFDRTANTHSDKQLLATAVFRIKYNACIPAKARTCSTYRRKSQVCSGSDVLGVSARQYKCIFLQIIY